jgi:hypothetical protein
MAAGTRQGMPDAPLAALRARSSGLHSLLALLIMLAAFLAQNVATQSHVHFFGAAPVAGASAATAGSAGQLLSRAPVGALPDCPLCRELATSGHYVLPKPVALFEGQLAYFSLFTASVAVLACRQRSHRWQSRAPPR